MINLNNYPNTAYYRQKSTFASAQTARYAMDMVVTRLYAKGTHEITQKEALNILKECRKTEDDKGKRLISKFIEVIKKNIAQIEHSNKKTDLK